MKARTIFLAALPLVSWGENRLVDEIAAADARADGIVASIASRAELAEKQAAWKKLWLERMGGLPEKTPLNARVTGKIVCKDFVAEKVLFQSQLGVFVTGLLYLPTDPKYKAPYPAVLIVHGHSDAGKLRDGYRRMAELAVKAGFAVFAPDPISQGERFQCDAKYGSRDCAVEHTSLGARAWLVGWNFARFRLWDAVRAIDFMETRPELDCSKLAVAGNSGGGTMSTYLQAFDERVKVACPNSYVSNLRGTVALRGVHDAEQFFFNQLPDGFNQASLLAMGQPRTALLVGARHQDYFPIGGTRETFAVLQGLKEKLDLPGDVALYSCDGPHGWAESSRQATLAWLLYHVKGEETAYCRTRDGKSAFDVVALRRIAGGFEHKREELSFPEKEGLVTATGQVRDLAGFKSVYALIRERAEALAAARAKPSRATLREIVRRRAGIHPLAELGDEPPPFKHPFSWWYLNGTEGSRVEVHAACLAVMGRSLVGERAETLLRDAVKRFKANGNKPVPLKARGVWCIAAAHAYAAEPQLFSSVELKDRPKSWLEMLQNPDPRADSFAVTVWGALEDYDWHDLVPTVRD